MDLSQRAQQTYDFFFLISNSFFEILAENSKIFKLANSNREAWILIKVQCVNISMDSTRQALQTNGKLFFWNFGIIFKIKSQFFILDNVVLGLGMRCGACADQHAFYVGQKVFQSTFRNLICLYYNLQTKSWPFYSKSLTLYIMDFYIIHGPRTDFMHFRFSK